MYIFHILLFSDFSDTFNSFQCLLFPHIPFIINGYCFLLCTDSPQGDPSSRMEPDVTQHLSCQVMHAMMKLWVTHSYMYSVFGGQLGTCAFCEKLYASN